MSDEKVQVVRRIFESWAKGDFRGGTDDLDPHVTFIVRKPFPEPVEVVGADAVARYMSDFLEQWDRLTIEAERFRPVGDTVLVRAVQRGAGKASGAATEVRYSQLFTFRGRKIVRVESILDEAEALEAAGLSE